MKKIRLIKCTPKFILGLMLSALGSITGIFIPLEIKVFVDSGKENTPLNFPLLLPIIYLFITQAILQISSEIVIYVNGEKRITGIRSKINNYILHLPMSFFNNESSSEIASHLINDTNTVKDFMTIEYLSFFSGIVTIVGSVFAIFSLDWKLSLMLLIIFPIMTLIIVPLGNIGGKYARNIQTMISNLISIAGENYQHIKLIKSNVAEKFVSKVFNNKINKLYRQSIKSDIVQSIVSPLGLIFLFGAIGIVFSYGGYRVSEGTLTVGTLMSFLIYIFQLLNPIGQFADFFTEYKKAQGAMSKLNDISRIKKERTVSQSEKYIKKNTSIYMKNISFSYGTHIILKKVNITIPRLKKTAIVGPSGAGKSTIINLIDRLYNPTEGKILLGDLDISTIDLYKWRSLFAIVSQENQIITGTIRDNLVFGLNYTPTEHQLFLALQKSDLREYVLSLPQKLDTFVGEKGIKLSGGQKQRLQIARIYLKNVPYIILDEATSNLDPDTEKIVMNAIDTFEGKKTIIVIAHRLATIQDADRIYFLDKHQITGRGTHTELLKYHSGYRRFVKEQMIK